MTTTHDLEDALEPIREGLETDGVSLQVTGRNGAALDITLQLRDNACAECLVPKEQLEVILHGVLHEVDASICSVTVTVAESA